MIEQEFINIISNVGFPIAMSVYLVLKFEKTLKENTIVIKELVYFLKKK